MTMVSQLFLLLLLFPPVGDTVSGPKTPSRWPNAKDEDEFNLAPLAGTPAAMGCKGKDVEWGDEREEMVVERWKNILRLRATRKALNQP
jgi:hypothetical protein